MISPQESKKKKSNATLLFSRAQTGGILKPSNIFRKKLNHHFLDSYRNPLLATLRFNFHFGFSWSVVPGTPIRLVPWSTPRVFDSRDPLSAPSPVSSRTLSIHQFTGAREVPVSVISHTRYRRTVVHSCWGGRKEGAGGTGGGSQRARGTAYRFDSYTYSLNRFKIEIYFIRGRRRALYGGVRPKARGAHYHALHTHAPVTVISLLVDGYCHASYYYDYG